LPLAAAAAVIVMIWLGAGMGTWRDAYPLREQKQDYYNLLVDGFQEGHLYMKAEVDPGRLSPDIEVRKRAPYLLDASQYNGHYYLYFGVVPALAAFWPYATLTGHDLPPNLAVLLAVAATFLILLRLYAEARAQYFPASPVWFDLTVTGLLAFATGGPVLLVSRGMYEVALSWGGMAIAAMAWSLFRALHRERSAAWWIAAASLAYGLGVGSRPTIFLLGPLVPIVAWLVWRSQAAAPHGRSLLRLAGATAIPAGLIGLGLMAYNYARFDNPLEFGLHYQINAITGTKLQGAAFIYPNISWYYLKPPTLSTFFPYIFPHSNYPLPAGYYPGSEGTHGQLAVLGLTLACVLAAVWLKPASARPLRWFLGLLAFSFTIMLLVTSTFAYRSMRYIVDFQTSLILLVVLLAGVVGVAKTSADWRPRAWLRVFTCLGTIVWVSDLLIGFQFLDRFGPAHPQAFQAMAHYGNYPASWLARLGWQRYGPVRFKVTFAKQPTPVFEVLAATGVPGHKDILYSAQDPTGVVDLIVFHEDYISAARSRLIPIEYGRPYEIELDMGSLCPPADADYFPHWSQAARDVLPTFTRVVFDGKEVVRTRQRFHDSSPDLLTFGHAPGRPERAFSGQITDIRRLPMRDAAALLELAETGVWRLELELPPAGQLEGQPLISSGVTTRGNMLFLQNLPDGRLQFVVDFWGVNVAVSAPLARPAGERHVLEVFVGSQVNRQSARLGRPAGAPAAPEIIRVWLDGQPVWSTPLLAYADTYDFVGIGTNPQGFSTTQLTYPMWLKRVPLSIEDARTLVEKNLASGLP
ncbi:MAG TPA: hypothetical protein VF388_02665, partial [Lacunisphaera sp.]